MVENQKGARLSTQRSQIARREIREINKGCKRNLQSQEINSLFDRDISAEPLSVLRMNLQ